MLEILGEAHFSKESVLGISRYIRLNKPDVLLHELAYNAEFTAESVKVALRNCTGHDICDPRTNMDIFRLCADLNIPLIGCDLSIPALASLNAMPLLDQFKHREARMLEVMKAYAGQGKVIAVVGDAHLRSGYNRLVESSPIIAAIRSGELKATYTRANPKLQEFK